MKLFPPLQLGLLNGWLPLAVLYIIFGLLLAVFPWPVVQRLYDKTGWKRENVPFIVAGKLFGLAALGLMIGTPLHTVGPLLWIGVGLYLLGLAGLVAALLNYNATPLDRPVTRGLYRHSRNPQIASLMLAFLGIAITCGSGTILALLLVAQLFHYRFLIREEERACLAQYGANYRAYMERTPRYFLFI